MNCILVTYFVTLVTTPSQFWTVIFKVMHFAIDLKFETLHITQLTFKSHKTIKN